MADELQKAFNQRKGVVLRHLAEEDSRLVKYSLRQLQISFDDLEQKHYDFHDTLDDPGEIVPSEKWFTAAQTVYIKGIKAANLWVETQPASGTQTVHDNKSAFGAEAGSMDQAKFLSLLNTPKVELESFTGDPLNYQTFFAIVDEAVGDNNSLQSETKLTPLLQYTTGEARSAIRNCALLGGKEGYEQARKILLQRFGNSHLIARCMIAGLTECKLMIKAKDIQQLSDDICSAHEALKQLDMLGEIDTQKGIIEILQRCPDFVKARWRKKALKVK